MTTPSSEPAHEITAAQAASYAMIKYGGLSFTSDWFAGLWEQHENAAHQGTVIQARWPGRCQGCSEPWEEGDDITWSGEESAWVCGSCAAQG